MNPKSAIDTIDTITNSIQLGGNVLVSGSHTPVSGSYEYGKEGAVSQALENAGVSSVTIDLSLVDIKDVSFMIIGIDT